MASFNGDFARLVPRNHVAQVLFSRTIAYVDKNDMFHLRFMERTPREPSSPSTEPVEESTEYDTYSETDRDDPLLRTLENSGFYVLSLDKNRGSELPHLGWRVGRGTSKLPMNRGVDLLLAKPGDNLGKSLVSTHLLLRFNLRSGFLVLSAESQKAPVEVKVDNKWEKLFYKEERLMYQSATIIRAGVCEYELEYTVKDDQREQYFKQRDGVFEAFETKTGLSFQTFRKLPKDCSVLKGKYLEFGTRGHGAFGWITQGVDIRTGDPVAIKELRINNPRTLVETLNEVRMGKRFLVSRLRDG